MKIDHNTINESLLLIPETVRFRNEHPETIQLWESQLGTEDADPDLHFCYHALEGYTNLCAQLDSTEYHIGFAINAHILHAELQRQFLENGLIGPLALEHANKGLHQMYRALDEEDLSGRAAILKSIQETT